MTQAGRIEAAILLLAAIALAPGRPADAVANDFFRARRYIGSGDRRSVSGRVWQVLRSWRRLSWWLNGNTKPRMQVAASLLLEGWTLEGVSLAYSGGQHAPDALSSAELAPLRRLAGQSLDHPDMSEAERLEIPDWLLPSLRAVYGERLAEEAAAWMRPAPLDLRVNVLKAAREAAREALAGEGFTAEPTPLSPWGLRVADRVPVTSGAAFQSGMVEIQDEGSQIVALLTDARPGMRVADWCAGAGGKTLALAMTMANKGRIVACDVSAKRLEASVARLRRAGVFNAEAHLTEEGDRWVKRRAGTFDRVLVDAPCTGTGTWRRNPDARLRLSPRDLAELAVKQAAILDQAERLVRKGGRLVYATCSLLPEENEQQVEAFLSRHPEYCVIPPQAVWEGADAGQMLRLSPARHGTDGFFCAILEKRGEEAGA